MGEEVSFSVKGDRRHLERMVNFISRELLKVSKLKI